MMVQSHWTSKVVEVPPSGEPPDNRLYQSQARMQHPSANIQLELHSHNTLVCSFIYVHGSLSHSIFPIIETLLQY